MHAEFDISECNLRYTTGDHLALWPSNATEHVNVFLKAFGLSDRKNEVIELKALDSTVSIPFHNLSLLKPS